MNICEVKDFLLNDNKKYLLEFYTHIYFFNQTTSDLYLGQTILLISIKHILKRKNKK